MWEDDKEEDEIVDDLARRVGVWGGSIGLEAAWRMRVRGRKMRILRAITRFIFQST